MSRPKIFYGWYIVGASLILIIMDGLLLYCFGVFLPYLNSEFGLSRAAGSSIFSIRSIVLAFSLVLAGRMVDKYDPRVVVISGGIIAALGMFLSGVSTNAWHLYLSYGFLIGLGDGVLYITCVAVVSRWFVKGRALAIGIITTGVPLSGLITNPVTAWLISSLGTRNSFFILGASVAVALLSALLLRGYPEEMNLKPYGEGELSNTETLKGGPNAGEWDALEAIRTHTFWLMYSMYFFGFTTFLVVVIHLFNFAIDSGISTLVASGAPACIGAGSVMGRVTLSGFLTEVIDNKKVLFFCFLLQGSSLFLLLVTKATWAFYIFGILFGFFYSGWVPIFPSLLGGFFGLKAMGTIYGFFGTSYCAAAIIGPPLAGYIHDATGTYSPAFLLCTFLCYVAAFFSYLIKSPQKKPKRD